MALRIFAFRNLAALVIAVFAFAAMPASAQTQVVCSYDHYGRPYNCHHTGLVVPQPQPQYQCGSCCNTCGNRGLFTTTWVQPTWVQPQPAPCGYNPCQQQVVIQTPQPAPNCAYVNSTGQCTGYIPQQTLQYVPQQYPQQVATDDDDDDVTVQPTPRYHRYHHRDVRTVHRHRVTERPTKKAPKYPLERAY